MVWYVHVEMIFLVLIEDYIITDISRFIANQWQFYLILSQETKPRVNLPFETPMSIL